MHCTGGSPGSAVCFIGVLDKFYNGKVTEIFIEIFLCLIISFLMILAYFAASLFHKTFMIIVENYVHIF